jgi:preprotein translocase subunit SecA
LEDKPVEAIQADVLKHLEIAQDKLGQVWGIAEFDRLFNAGHTLANLTESWQQKMSDQMGQTEFDSIKSKQLNQLEAENRDQIVTILGRAAQNRLYRHLLLSKISELWIDYLTKVEALRVSVRMESYAQRDPLVVYKGEASTMFAELLSDIRAGVIDQMFRARLVSREEMKKMREVAKQTGAAPTEASTSTKKKSRRRH